MIFINYRKQSLLFGIWNDDYYYLLNFRISTILSFTFIRKLYVPPATHIWNIYTYTEWPKPQTKLNFTFWNRAKPYGLCPPCPQPAFCLWKNFSQRISLIRDLRKCRNKGKQSTKTNNSLVIKHSWEPLVLPQGLWIAFWAITYELSCIYWNSHQVEEVNYMMTKL